jgi:hypothetical protein
MAIPPPENPIYAEWSKGNNNLASKDRLPAGFVRRSVNVDPTPGGRLQLRTGFEKVYTAAAARGMLSLGDNLLVADGTSLIEFNTRTNSSRVVRTIAGAGVLVGAELAGVLYFCTENECLEYNGTEVRPWGVQQVAAQPVPSAVAGGSLAAGVYQLAVTFLDQWGREGGTDRPIVITVADGQSLSVSLPTPPAGGKTLLYVSHNEGATLYLQHSVTAPGTVLVGFVRDDTARLATALLQAPTPGHIVATHNATLVLAIGPVLWATLPFRAHLMDRAKSFYQFPATIGAVISVAPALYVSADKSYRLVGVETSTPEAETVLEYPAVPGTAVQLPDGRGAWMSKFGQIILPAAGAPIVANEGVFAPALVSSGAAAVVNHNGNQLIVTSTQGQQGANQLAATDSFEGEIISP